MFFCSRAYIQIHCLVSQAIFFGFLLFLTSCKSNPNLKSDPYLYDRPGFDRGMRPNVQNDKNDYTKVVPDYYYRQPSYPAQQQYYQPPGYPPQQNYQQQGYPAQYPTQAPSYYYPPQVPPGSRFYSNPYAIPPSNYNYPYYDGDQYYVPPTSYNGVEGQQSGSGNRAVDIHY